jgi:superfamily II DNA/RNA helicase
MIEASRPATANASIDQRLVRVDARKKKDVLVRLLETAEVTNAIVFSNRKTTVRELAQSLKRSGFKSGQIHGDMEQPERIKELDRFKTGEINILVASDVAARGLDIKGVSHVFNYDVPWQPDDYIHRIGRTGRAGATGIAITLATAADADQLAAIERMIGAPIRPLGDAEAPPAPKAEEAPAAAEPEAKPKAEQRAKRPARRPRKSEAPHQEPEAAQEREPEEAAPLPRPERQPTEARRPREERRPSPQTRRPEPRAPEPEAAEDDEWNGPVPSFLTQRIG